MNKTQMNKAQSRATELLEELLKTETASDIADAFLFLGATVLSEFPKDVIPHVLKVVEQIALGDES